MYTVHIRNRRHLWGSIHGAHQPFLCSVSLYVTLLLFLFFTFFLTHRENLSVQGFSWYARYVALNLFLFILLTLFTTPTIIINTMDKFNVTKPINALNVRLAHANTDNHYRFAASLKVVLFVFCPRAPSSVSSSPRSCCGPSLPCFLQ